MPSAGSLFERVAFQSRTETADGYGNMHTVFTTRFRRQASFITRSGSESVLAARLEGRQPMTIIVSSDSQTREVTTDWRIVDDRNGQVYAITAAEDMDRRRQWITFICARGISP
jgi:SPP1 family predicted phage head-tail adaptor